MCNIRRVSISFTPFHVPCHMTHWGGGAAQCRVKAAVHHTPRCHKWHRRIRFSSLFKAEKEKKKKTHFLSLALTLTYTLSPNHLTTSSFPSNVYGSIVIQVPYYTTHAQYMLHPHISREGASYDVKILRTNINMKHGSALNTRNDFIRSILNVWRHISEKIAL